MDIRDYAFGEEKTISICFRGIQEDWDDAVGGSVVLFRSLVFSDLSADAVFTLPKAAYNYTGNAIEPAVMVNCTNVASGMKESWETVNGATRYKVYRDGKPIECQLLQVGFQPTK